MIIRVIYELIYELIRGIYELPHKLPKDIRLGILENFEISGKSQNLIELKPSAQSSSQNENFVNTSKKLLQK